MTVQDDNAETRDGRVGRRLREMLFAKIKQHQKLVLKYQQNLESQEDLIRFVQIDYWMLKVHKIFYRAFWKGLICVRDNVNRFDNFMNSFFCD